MIPIEDLTDVTLAIEDTDEEDKRLDWCDPGESWYLLKTWLMLLLHWGSNESYPVMKIIKWWKLSSDESYQVMKVIKWSKLSSDESYQVMKVVKWWKLSSDESCQVMNVVKWW